MSCETTKSGCGCGPDCKCGCQPAGAYAGYKTDCGPKDKKCCPIKCALTIILGGLLAAMVMYLFEGFWHGTYLAPVYDQTKQLWRSYADMQSLSSTYAGVTIAIGIVLSFIFAKNYKGKGVAEGIRYGFYIGVLLGLRQASAYLYMPISMNLANLWFFGWIIEGVLVGITLALTFMAVTGKKDCKPKGHCGTEVKSGCN